MLVSQRRNPATLLIALLGGLAAAMLAYAAATGSLLVLIGLAVLAAAVVIIADWTIGVPLLLIASVTDGFIKHVAATPVAYIIKDTILALLLLGLFIRMGANAERGSSVRWRGVIVWSAYVLFLATQIVHPAAGFAGALGAFRAHAAFALLFLVGAVYFARRDRLTRTANFAIVLCTVCALAGIAQHLLGDAWLAISPGLAKASMHYTAFPSAAAEAQGLAGAVYRAYGTLVDPAALGLACAYGMLFAIASLARLRGAARIVAFCAIPVMGAALALSGSRASMAGLGAGVIVLVLAQLARKATRPFAIASLITIGLAIPAGIALTHGTVIDRLLDQGQVTYAQRTRDISVNLAIDGIGRYPFGHGLGATGAGGYLREEAGLGIDNIYFSNLYESGILGLGLFLALQVTLLGLALRAVRRTRDLGAQTVFTGIVASQVALLTASWFLQGAFDYAPLAQCFWLFAGAVARADEWA